MVVNTGDFGNRVARASIRCSQFAAGRQPV